MENGPLMRAVLVFAVLVVAVMATIKDGRALHRIGLTGSCSTVATPAGQAGSWERCVAGKLEGAPDLSRQGCLSAGTYGKAEFWKCPARLKSGPNV
jgi:hypothetical protein